VGATVSTCNALIDVDKSRIFLFAVGRIIDEN
jgi:hypothetical protein